MNPWDEKKAMNHYHRLNHITCGVVASWILTGVLIGWSPVVRGEQVIHEFEKLVLTDKFYSEGAGVGDFNRDGKMDIVAGPYWYEGPGFDRHHAYYEPKAFDVNGYSDNFLTFVEDLNGDGWQDILVVGWPGRAARWYVNPGLADGKWPVHEVLDGVDNESPLLADITGDGRPELICSRGGYFGFAAPEGGHVERPWRFVRISNEQRAGGRYTHGLGIGDVNGDGRMDLLEKNGWWAQPVDWDGSPNWTFHPFQFADAGGAQMFAYDIDGDGDNDVITSLNAHGYGLAWYEQSQADGVLQFTRHDIMTGAAADTRFGVAFSQLHSLALVDMYGDGLKDIVTGKRWWAHNGHDVGTKDPAVIYWFQLVRRNGEVEFIPQPIDSRSGVGTQVWAGDVNGDGLADVVAANKHGAFVHLHRTRAVDRGTWFWRNHPAMKSAGKSAQATAAEMSLPKGFQAQLFAGEPDVHQPIGFAIDHAGRLWVAENYSYPNWAPTGHDDIVIFEDTDGDGVYDKRTVFYDKLNFVSGIEVGFGGVFVGSPPHQLFILDRNGDLRPDGEPQVLLDGWGHNDTHETLNSFTWGPDGWLYGCQGVFTHSRVGRPGTADERRQPMNAGIWRYHPLKRKFEVFAHGTSNPWGVDFDEHGECFLTCCVIPHAYHIIEGGRYRRQSGRHFNRYTYDDIKTIVDHLHFPGGMRDWTNRADAAAMDKAGGGHAHAGAMIYLGDNWPQTYRGHLFMNNIHGNRINQDILKPDGGSGYVTSHAQDFMRANDKWYRGLCLRYGPDGGVFACDWYDQRACHQQQPHDRTNGRIYKITYGKPDPVRVDLSKRSDMELVALQRSRNAWYARMARRLLMERGGSASVHAALWRMLEEEVDTIVRLRALWALHVTGGLDEGRALHLLDDPAPFVRGWVIQLRLEDASVSESLARRLVDLAKRERSPIVRKYLAASLQRMAFNRRWVIAEQLLQRGEDEADHNIAKLTWYGVEPLVELDPARAMRLAEGAKLTQVKRWLIRRASAEAGSLPAAIALLERAVTPAEQQLILDEMVAGLANFKRVPMPGGWQRVYERLSGSNNAGVRDRVAMLAVRFGDHRIFPRMRRILADVEAAPAERRTALDVLVAGDDVQSLPLLQGVLGEPSLRGQALRGLSAHEHADTPSAILKYYDTFQTDEKRLAIGLLASRPNYARSLLDAVEAGRVSRGEVHVYELRQMLRFSNEQFARRIRDIWGIVRKEKGDKSQQIARWKRRLTPEYLATADPHHGRAVFNQTCAVCHKLFGEGGDIGPDLTGANRADLDYVLLNVLDPNAVIGPDYQMRAVELSDGRLISGLVRGETDSTLTISTPTERFVLDRSTIEHQEQAGISMMPEGLFAAYQDSDVRDLIAYLASPVQVLPSNTDGGLKQRVAAVAGLTEGEALKVVELTGGETQVQDMRPFKADDWSGGAHLW